MEKFKILVTVALDSTDTVLYKNAIGIRQNIYRKVERALF